jgi:Ni,Fe-hydrogenase I small subunit
MASVARCGFTIVVDGEEEPCDREATGWRWYQGHDHEDMLDDACWEHENVGGYRMHVAEGAVHALASALTRTEANFRLAVEGKPVRDMAENLAENASALAAAGYCEPCGRIHQTQEDADDSHYDTDGDYYGRRYAGD